MKRRCFLNILLATCLAAAFVTGRAETNTIIIPGICEATFGNARSGVLYAPPNVQQFYSVSAFARARVDVLKITEIAFRVDETTSDANGLIYNLRLYFGTFPGTMQEIAEKGPDLGWTPTVLIFSGTNVTMRGKAGQLDVFDIRFPVDPPFIYDRRKGQLALLIADLDLGLRIPYLDNQTFRDAEQHPVFDEGALVIPGTSDSDGSVDSNVLVTKFSYTIFQPVITRIIKNEGKLEVEFTFDAEHLRPIIEEAPEVSGPYLLVSGAPIAGLADHSYRATLSVPATNRFYRIVLLTE